MFVADDPVTLRAPQHHYTWCWAGGASWLVRRHTGPGSLPSREVETVLMSTRKLIITALITGLVILVAGAVQLVMIMS